MFTHGMKKMVSLVILSIATELNKNNKLGVAVIPQAPFYDGGVWQTSPADLERLAKECGAYEMHTFAKVVNTNAKRGGEDCELALELEYCEAGQSIGLNADGTPILNKEGGSVYTKSFWNVRNVTIKVSDDVADRLSELADKVGVQLALAKVAEDKDAQRAEKRARDIARANGNKTVTETPVDTGLDVE